MPYDPCKDPCFCSLTPYAFLFVTWGIATWLYVGKTQDSDIKVETIVFAYTFGFVGFFLWQGFAILRMLALCCSRESEKIYPHDDFV